MIKANSLRPGNWIKTDKAIHSVIKLGGLTINGHAEWRYYPIPLTDEMFIQLGFDEFTPMVFTKDRFLIEKGIGSSNNVYSFRITTNNHNSTHVCNISSLHDLQNIWSICKGEELNITL